MEQYLTYDEKKAAEAAFCGLPCDPKWSKAARDVYDGILKALHAHAPRNQSDEIAVSAEADSSADASVAMSEAADLSVKEATEEKSEGISVLNRDEAIEAGILIDVTPLAQELGLNLPVGISKPLWEIGITASNKLRDAQYNERVRDVLLALRLHLETTEVSSPWIKFHALLSFPPEAAPQVCSLYAVAHRDSSAPYSLTLLLPHEMSAIKPPE